MTSGTELRASVAKPPESLWLSSRRQQAETSMDLYCFAHAGGSAGEFLRWSSGLTGVRLWAVKTPGRVPRHTEPAYTRMTDLVGDLVEQVEFGRREFAFFGHSLGALVAFEVTRALRRAGRRLPRRLFVSSMQPPPIRTSALVRDLPTEQLLAVLEERWGALPQIVHDDEDLRDLVVGCLRADAELAETYAYVEEEPLDIPITAFVGDQENHDQLGWHTHTHAAIETHVLRGGHFYFRDQDQQRELLRLIDQALTAEH